MITVPYVSLDPKIGDKVRKEFHPTSNEKDMLLEIIWIFGETMWRKPLLSAVSFGIG